MAIVNCFHGRVERFLFQINATEVLFLIISAGPDAPLADLFIDDQFRRTVFVRDSP